MMLYAIKSTINDRTESFCFITALESLSFTETVSNCLTNTRIDYMAK